MGPSLEGQGPHRALLGTRFRSASRASWTCRRRHRRIQKSLSKARRAASAVSNWGSCISGPDACPRLAVSTMRTSSTILRPRNASRRRSACAKSNWRGSPWTRARSAAPPPAAATVAFTTPTPPPVDFAAPTLQPAAPAPTATFPAAPPPPRPPPPVVASTALLSPAPSTTLVAGPQTAGGASMPIPPWVPVFGAALTGGLLTGALVGGHLANQRNHELQQACGMTDAGCPPERVSGLRSLARMATTLWIATAVAGTGTGIAIVLDARAVGLSNVWSF